MNDKLDFLFELGTEELPPQALRTLSESLSTKICAGFDKAGLTYNAIKNFATPRRLAILASDLATHQPPRLIEKRGPALNVAFDKNGNPTPQARGFARSCGIEVSQLAKLQNDKGSWLIFRTQELGRPARELLPEIVHQALAELPIPKKMRWGALKVEFVRPVHWVVMLLGDTIVDAEILGQRAGRETRGHRFHYPAPISLPNPATYSTILENVGFVLADFTARRSRIYDQITTAAATLNGRALFDESLLDEVTSLVEWPIPVIGNFAPSFLEIPAEALIATMQGKQKYFPVVDCNGKLLPHFITISNICSSRPELVQAGNERVIHPRLSDAAFFWEQDRRRSLSDRIDALHNILFQEHLGTVYDKSVRVGKLSAIIATHLNIPSENAERAALLAKCDLLTDMVGEFPELQGIIGRYLAQEQGESPEISQAIEEQYWPRFAGDRLPITLIGQVLAIAERIDTLVGIFAIGHPPTGDKDPFALRRAALGVLRIILEKQLNLDLFEIINYANTNLAKIPGYTPPSNLIDQVYDFMLERLRAYFLEQDFHTDEFDAVMARRPTQPLDFYYRLQAVHLFRALPEAISLIAAHKRIKNILRQSQESLPDTINEQLLGEAAERQLFYQVRDMIKEITPIWERRDYQEILTKLAGLKVAVDHFFDKVMVMTDNHAVRINRLALLQIIYNLFLRIADISLLSAN